MQKSVLNKNQIQQKKLWKWETNLNNHDISSLLICKRKNECDFLVSFLELYSVCIWKKFTRFISWKEIWDNFILKAFYYNDTDKRNSPANRLCIQNHNVPISCLCSPHPFSSIGLNVNFFMTYLFAFSLFFLLHFQFSFIYEEFNLYISI